jgi:apolipoprotein N-acyltransferase
VNSLTERALNLTGWRQLAACLFAGGLASLTLPPFGLVPLALALSYPALCIARTGSTRRAAMIGCVTGFGWFLVSLWWISLSLVTGDINFWPLLPLPLLGIPLLLSLFWVPASAAAHRFVRSEPGRIAALALSLGLCEWARGYVATGFPWNAPGYLFSAHLTLLQAASLFGLYGLSLLAILWCLAPAFWLAGQRRLAIAFGLILPVLMVSGAIRLATIPTPSDEIPKTVRIVQPVVPQHEKWDRALRPQHLGRLQELSRTVKPVPPLIIWPETAFAGLLDREGDRLRQTAWETLPFDGWLVTGVPRFDAQRRLFNSAALIRAKGQVEALYDKRRLVPFGEFVPFRSLLPFADALVGPVDFSPGTENRLIAVPGYGNLQLLICYETLFPGVGRGFDDGLRPDILVNLTNDAWFGHTPGPWQHLAQAQMRAVEEGLAMIRVANTGISAGFDPLGRQIARIGLGESGFADLVVPPPLSGTIYDRWRDVPLVILILANLLLVIRLDHKRMIRH